jgi:lysophospholipase L1-like esterase
VAGGLWCLPRSSLGGCAGSAVCGVSSLPRPALRYSSLPSLGAAGWTAGQLRQEADNSSPNTVVALGPLPPLSAASALPVSSQCSAAHHAQTAREGCQVPYMRLMRLLAAATVATVHSISCGGARGAVIGCVGDSITQGVGASCPPCPTKGPLQPCGLQGCAHAWPAQLQQQVGSSHTVLNWGHVAATMQSTTNCADKNCGGRHCLAGEKTVPCRSNGPPYWVTREFARATNRSAPLDVVVIMLGTNDAKANNWLHLGNQTQYAEDAQRMVQTFMSLPQAPRVYLSTPPPLYHATYSMNQTVVGSIMPRVLRAVARRLGCEFIDMIAPLGGWPALTKPELFLPNRTNGGCDTPHQCKGDGCHPDDLGHSRIATVVAAALHLTAADAAIARADANRLPVLA